MENSFLDGIISGALAAQEACDSGQIFESTSSGSFDKDGYVGEMVRSFFEAETTVDYSRSFGKDMIVMLTSLDAKASGASITFDYANKTIDSIEDLIFLISSKTGIGAIKENTSVFLDDSQKINIIFKGTEYGDVVFKIGVDIYQEIKDKNSVLNLPR